jgi:hypothetical protein
MPETFEAGDRAPSSGIYKAVHANLHAEPHYVTALYGDTFPACQKCSRKIRFELAISAVHLNAHPLFMSGQNR